MVKYSNEKLDLIFHALSDTTRRAMLRRLARRELSVSELAQPYQMSLAAVSKHLKVLQEADFVSKTKDGRSYKCRANLLPLEGVTGLLEELGAHWRQQLDSLELYFKEEDRRNLEKEGKNGKNRKK